MRATAVADVTGPNAYISTSGINGSRVYTVSYANGEARLGSSIAAPSGQTDAAAQLRAAGNTLYAQFGGTIYKRTGNGWQARFGVPAGSFTWLANGNNRQVFVGAVNGAGYIATSTGRNLTLKPLANATTKAALEANGTVVTGNFEQLRTTGKSSVTRVPGSLDDGVIVMTGSKAGGNTVWAVTQRGDSAYMQRSVN